MKFFSKTILVATVLLTLFLSARAEPEEHRGRKDNTLVQQPSPRSLDVPRRLADIRRDLKVGTAWVAISNERPNALRAGLEVSGKLVAALTLDPSNGKPVAFMERGNYRPNTLPSEALLGTYLSGLRKETTDLKFGAYLLPSPRGLEVQVYWTGKLVSYLYVDPNNGNVQTDETSSREIVNSPLRVR